jgi:hypothetical protein
MAPPPQAAPLPQRQPQTGSDPGNQGANVAQQLSTILTQVLEGQALLGTGLTSLGKAVTGVSTVQRSILQLLLILLEQQGVDEATLSALLKDQDPAIADKLLARMGAGGGK